jgi:hypothetical protein
MTKTDTKQAFWSNHIQGWKESGGNQREYCNTHGLALATFSYWRKKLSDRPADSLWENLVEVPPQVTHHEAHTAEALVIRVHETVEIRITPGCDLEFLARVITVIASR